MCLNINKGKGSGLSCLRTYVYVHELFIKRAHLINSPHTYDPRVRTYYARVRIDARTYVLNIIMIIRIDDARTYVRINNTYV